MFIKKIKINLITTMLFIFYERIPWKRSPSNVSNILNQNRSNTLFFGILFVVLFVTPTLYASAISDTNRNASDERPFSKSFHFYRALIIGIVSNYEEDAEYIHFNLSGLVIAVEIYEGNPYPPITMGFINEHGSWNKSLIDDFFRGILTPHFLFGVLRA
jgi:hypothetical protein